MAPKPKSVSNTAGLLSSKAAANLLRWSPDYVAKLCRDGKLACVRENKAWFVERDSVGYFRHARQLLKVARSEELAQLRRQELGLLVQSEVQPQWRPPAMLTALAVVTPLLLAIVAIFVIKSAAVPATSPSASSTVATSTAQ